MGIGLLPKLPVVTTFKKREIVSKGNDPFDLLFNIIKVKLIIHLVSFSSHFAAGWLQQCLSNIKRKWSHQTVDTVGWLS